MSAKKGWEIISRSYQKSTKISLQDVHYGPISPGESELRLLGDVMSKDILEVGCGGGQNSIVLSKWGGNVVGLDISRRQIEHARKLATKEHARVRFYLGNMENLRMFADRSFDVVLSSFALGYVDDLGKAFAEIHRVLRKRGIFVFADSHPVANRGRVMRYGKTRRWTLANYFDRKNRKWIWRAGKRVAEFLGHKRTIQDYFDLLTLRGFVIRRILEPEPYHIDRLGKSERRKIPYLHEWYVRTIDLWKRVPYTIIFKCEKAL